MEFARDGTSRPRSTRLLPAARTRSRWRAAMGRWPPYRRGGAGVQLPFVCVPAGTRNHFARDLGLDPADPTAGFDALSDGIEGRIDVGEVSGHLFLNNVSLGIYAEAVPRRGVSRCEARTWSRPRAASSAQAPRSPDWTSSTTSATAIPILRSCSCRTTLRPGRTVLARRPPDAERRSARDRVIDRPATGRRPQVARGAPFRCGSMPPAACTPGSTAKRSSCQRRSSSRSGRRRCGSERLAGSVPPATALERGDGQRRQGDTADRPGNPSSG